MNADPLVAIVILNWNGRHYLQQFLPSVLATTYSNYKVIVADNASTDESIPFLKTHYPQVELLLFEVNYGFAKGYNEALQRIDAPYYLLLNSDVEVTAGWIQPMVSLLEDKETYAACQPKILSYQKKRHFDYAGAAGGWIDHLGYPFARGRIFDICEKDTGQYDKVQQVFWASGAALLIKSKAFHAAAGFDEAFFAHQEEIDLCWRLQLQGYKILCNPQVLVYHVGGGTLPRGNSRKTFLNFRNNLMMLTKNLSRREAWWKIPFRLVLDQISAFKGLLSGDLGYWITISKAHIAFYKWLFSKKGINFKNRKKMATLTGVYRQSIVWQHFIKGKSCFSEIIKESKMD